MSNILPIILLTSSLFCHSHENDANSEIKDGTKYDLSNNFSLWKDIIYKIESDFKIKGKCTIGGNDGNISFNGEVKGKYIENIQITNLFNDGFRAKYSHNLNKHIFYIDPKSFNIYDPSNLKLMIDLNKDLNDADIEGIITFGELHERSEIIEYKNDEWTRKLIGISPTKEQFINLQDKPFDIYEYPRSISMGENWIDNDFKIIKIFDDNDLKSLNGSCKNELENVKVENNDQIAIINTVCNLNGIYLDNDYDEFKFDLTHFSVTERSLNKKIDVNTNHKGILSFEHIINPEITIKCTGKYEYYEFAESQNICEKCKY